MNDAARYRDEIRKLQRCILRLKRKLDSRDKLLLENAQLRREVRVIKGREFPQYASDERQAIGL